jgi:hypothetical protein
MTPYEALTVAVSKIMNKRYSPESYADLFENPSTTRKRIEDLKERFGWSTYQTEEVIRMVRILLPTSIDIQW